MPAVLVTIFKSGVAGVIVQLGQATERAATGRHLGQATPFFVKSIGRRPPRNTARSSSPSTGAWAWAGQARGRRGLGGLNGEPPGLEGRVSRPADPSPSPSWARCRCVATGGQYGEHGPGWQKADVFRVELAMGPS